MVFFFFFQAEDGIRDRNVTGVQTCALPIWLGDAEAAARVADGDRPVAEPRHDLTADRMCQRAERIVSHYANYSVTSGRRRKETPDARPRGGNARAMALRPQGTARSRERAHAPRRRARPTPTGTAVGAGRNGVHLRVGRRDEDARGSFRRPLTAARLPLHVRRRVPGRRTEPRLHGLLVRRRPLR